MIDSLTRERIVISDYGTASSYILIPMEQLSAVEAVLRENHVVYWVDSEAISINGKPEVIGINFGRGTDLEKVQRLLDSAN